MKQYLSLFGAFALAACGGGDDAAAPAAEGDVATVSAPSPDSPLIGEFGGLAMDGQPWGSTIKADGTYQDTQGGEVTEAGTWTHEGDQVCFSPSVAAGEGSDATCLTLINVNDDGSLLMSDGAGNETTVPKLSQ